MALDDVMGGGDFSPDAAVDDLIRQQTSGLPDGSLSPDMLANRLYRKLGQQKPEPAAAPPVARGGRDAAPAADAKAPDFSDQGVPADQLPDFSDQGVPADAVPMPQPRPAGAPGPTTPNTIGTYATEFGKGVLEGTKNMGASALKGVAAAGIPTAADPKFLDELGAAKDMTPGQRAKLMGRVLREVSDRPLQMDYNAALRRIANGADPAAEVEKLRPKFDANNKSATEPVTDKPLYKAGHAIEEFGKEALAPAPGFEPGKSWTRDIGSGAGSMVAGIAASMIPGIGPVLAGSLFTTAGMGEATENAVKGGATNDQIRRATMLGGVAGATDLVDALLPMLGSTGKAMGFLKRVGLAAVKGALMEGGQEGIQQLMQNAIAKGIYKPDQDLFEDVPRSIAIAAILGGAGGGLSGAAHRNETAAQPGLPPPGAQPSAAPGPGPTAGPSGAGPEQSSPEDIADFVRRARESAPPQPESEAPAGPDPSAMSEAERLHAYAASRDSHGGASETEILKAAGLDPATMSEQERIDAVIRATKPKESPSSADSTAQAEPQQETGPEPESSHLRYATLRAYGYSDEDIDNMSVAQRKREFNEAVDSGIKPGEAMGKHPKRAPKAATSESDVGSAPQAHDTTGLKGMGTGMAGGIGDSLRDHLWERAQAGEVTENSSTGPTALLQGAKMARARGGLKTRDEFVAYADEQAKLTQGSPSFQQDMRALVDKHSPKGGDGTRKAPSRPHTAEDVSKAKPAQPTEAQAKAGNYVHSHIELPQLGLTGNRSISIETGQGGTRSGKDADGKPWSVKLDHAAYGRIKGTKGADGEHLDIFIGPHPTSEHVFVIDQHHPGGGFDEHKIMAGFRTPVDALHAYAHSYNDAGKDRIGHVTAMSPEDFKAWLETDTTKALKKEPPASEPVKAEADGSISSAEARLTSGSVPKETPTVAGAADGGSAPIMQDGEKSSPPTKSQDRQRKVGAPTEEPLSLLQFIASKGGLRPDPELTVLDIGDHRAKIPGRKGFFGVIRPTGMRLDQMREAAEEAGYFRGEHNKTSTIRDLLDAIDTELRGNAKHAEGEEGHTTKRQRTSLAESSAAARDSAIAANVETIKAEYTELPDGLAEQAATIMADEMLDVDSAVEMAAVRAVNEDADYEVSTNDITSTYGEGAIDAIRPQAASEDGGPSAPTLDQEQQPGEGEEASRDGEPDARDGAEGTGSEGKAVAKPYEFTADRTQPTQIVPLPMELAEFQEITDEWAALFTDPDQKINLETTLGKGPFIPMAEAQARVDQWRADAAAQAEDSETFQANSTKTILSLYDLTGNWARPWAEAGYNVLTFDIQSGQDINDFSVEYFNENYDIADVYGILIAQPCTDFAVSGARHFAEKDARGDTAASIELTHQSLRTVEYFKPKFWALENPVSRIEKLTGLPKWRLLFNPNNFGDPYTKKTVLWGKFNGELPTANVDPVEGSKMWAKYGGKSAATKNARSATPEGFAYAFFKANNYADRSAEDRLPDDYPEVAGAVRAALKAGVSEARINELMENTYGNYEYDQARDALIAEAHGVKLPAVRDDLFVQIDGKRLPLLSYAQASEAYVKTLDKTGATMSGETGPQAPPADIVDAKGNVVAHISQNGKVWSGDRKTAFEPTRAEPTTLLYNPYGPEGWATKGQTSIPGTEPIGQGEQAQRAIDKPLKPKVPQKPADAGLFGDEKDQTDLLDRAKIGPTEIRMSDWQDIGDGYSIREMSDKGPKVATQSIQEIKTPDGNILTRGIDSNGNEYQEYDTGSNPMAKGGMAWVDDALAHLKQRTSLPQIERGEPLIDLDGATADIQAGDSDETVTVTLTRRGPWDFNDTWPAPDMKVIAASAAEGRSFFDEGQPDVEQVVAMLDEGMNAITSAIAEIRAIDGRMADIRSGKIKLKKRQTIEQALDPLQRDRGRYAAEVRDTAAAHEELFGRQAANAMIAESRRRLRNEETQSPVPPPRAPLDAIETALGEDADKVAPVDIARAGEIMADNPGMDVATAFGQAVIETAVEQGFITEQEAEEAYGPEAKDLLEAGRQGALGSGAELEQGSATSGEVGAGGAAQTGELPGSGETGIGQADSEAGSAASPAAAVEAAEQPAAGSDETEHLTAAQIAANARKLTDRQIEMLESYADGNEAADYAEFADTAGAALGWRNRERVIDALHKKGLLDPDGLTEAGWAVLARERPGNADVARRAERDAPTWAEILATLPMSPDGRTRQHEIAFGLMTEITGDPRPKYADLTPAQKHELMSRLAPAAEKPTLQAGETDGIPASVHAGDAPASPEDVQPVEPGGDAGGVREREGSGSEQAVPRADGERTEGAGRVSEGALGEGSDRASDVGDAGLSGSRNDDAADGRTQRHDERAADSVEGENFTIEPGALDEGRSFLTKARDNITAIETMQRIEAEGRPATRAEQEVLSKYVGWGGIKGAFPDSDGKFGYETIGKRLIELLDETEYATARRSIQYAHYTSEDIVRSMWAAVSKMGFAEGQVFEPGMGVGNFAGMMPTGIAANTHYAGLELDHTTARIAKLLYPKWGVRQDDFTKAPLPENNYDLVIGNPPFADIPIKSDAKYKQGFLLHDYFFAKSIDAVRPGGLLAFVTSAGTMNKIDTAAREYIADRADLVGAIRLPGNAFAKNAGTEVTTDIVFLRKRLPGDLPGDRTWTETVETTLPNSDGMKIAGNVNRYFAEHPEMVLGEQGFFDKLYKNRYAVRAIKGSDIKSDLAAAVARLPADVMTPWQNVNADHAAQDFDTTEKKEGTYYVGPDGSLHQITDGVGRKVGQRGKGVENGRTAADMERIKGLIPVRDSLRAVYAADLKGDTANADRARDALNKSYDAFVAAFGPINKSVIQTRRPNVIQMENARAEAREEARYAGVGFREGTFNANPMLDAKTPLSVIARKRQEARDEAAKNNLPFDEGDFDIDEVPDVIIDKRPNVDPFMDDPESYRLRAIERYDEGTGKGHKSPVFTENVIKRETVPKISSVNDALLYSLSQYGRVNLPAMAELSKKSEAQVIEALGEHVFLTPGTKDHYETRDEYLSGDVRKKLALAQRAADKNPDFRRNVTALEAAQPMPLAPSQIHATLGMPWIPVDVVQDFGKTELGLDSLKVKYIAALATWAVSGDTDSVAASTTWGTADRRAPALLQDALNRQSPKIYDKHRDVGGREVSTLNITKTEAAQDKIRAIQEKFAGWIWSDEARSDRLAGFYNENFNNLVVREYNGDYLTTPGIASSWTWRPHQKRVIARAIQSGNTYIAHAVGGGKTSEYIGIVMEKRRLGLARKPMITVPNHMLAQFTKEFYEQYPMARLAIADDKRFHTDRRKQFIANVAMEDLDAIIITHSAFGMIPVSAPFQNSIIQREISQYRELLAQLSNDRDNRITRSRIEKQIERLEQRLVSRTGRKDSVFTFEEMGVDDLTVDEAHLFRKLDFATNMTSLKGVSPEGSAMAWDLYVKTLYLESIRPGRGLVFGSGTPITNTMAELYTVSRFMQPQVLAERGLEKFDAWAGAFGESVSELEQDAAGNYKPVSRFAKFVNVAELSAMVRQIMDVVTSKQLSQYVTRPEIKGGKRQMHLAEKSRALIRFQESLAARMKVIQNRKGPPKKGDDIMLSVINDGRHAAIDMRLAGGEASDEPSKLEMMVENIFEIWKATKRQPFYKVKPEGGYEDKPAFVGPATQLAFVNLGLSGARGFSVPDYIRAELTRRGVPKDEIAYIYDHKSATAKQRLFNDMNEGKKRILIGSVAKMGVGTNVQRRLSDIHNMDPLWYPADDEQRNGRGIRQGNMNREIGINDYSTKGTYDSTMWGMMAKKGKFIEGFFEGDPSLRDMDDLGESSQYEQAKALTTNDPRLIRFTEIKQELERANRRKSSFDSETYNTRQRRARAASEIEHYQQRVLDTQKDIAQRVDTSGDNFKGKIGTTTFDKRVDFGVALFEKLDDLGKKGTLGAGIKVAEVGGFPIYATARKSSLVKDSVTVDVFMALNGVDQTRDIKYELSSIGTVRSIEGILHGFESALDHYKETLAKAQKFYVESESKAKAKFEGDAEIEALTKQFNDMAAELAKPIDGTEPRTAPPATEGEEALADASAGGGLTLTPAQRAAVESAVREAIQRMVGNHVTIEFSDRHMPMPGVAAGAWGNIDAKAAGLYWPWRKLIQLAMDPHLASNTSHEAYHAIEYQLQTPAEREMMERETPRIRDAIRDYAKEKYKISDEQIDALDGEEIRAIGFEQYAMGRVNGIHITARRWYQKLFDMLKRLAQVMRGIGYQSYEDVFGKAYEGGYRDAAGDTPRPEANRPADNGPALASIQSVVRAVNERVGRKIDLTEVRTQLQDKFIRVRKAEESVGGVPSSLSAYQAESLYYGRTGEQLERLEENDFDPLISNMKARGINLEAINEYLYAKHAPERNRAMDAINHPNLDIGGRDLRGRGSGMSDEDAQAIMDRITAAGKMADFEAIEARVRKIVDDARNYLVDSGLISQETADAWAAQYEFYVPLRGFEEGTEDESLRGRGAGFDTRARETQQAFGRLSRADGPLAYVMQQAEMAIVRGEKNKVGNAWLRFVRSNPAPERWTIDTPPTKKTIDKRTGLVTTVADQNWHLKPDVFVTKVGGRPVLIQLHGKDGLNLARALKNMGTSNLNSVLRFMHALTSTMSRLATQWNPNFTLPNLTRDVGEAFINLQAQDQANFVKRFSKHLFPSIKGAFDALRGAQGGSYAAAFREFDEAGGRIRFFGLENHDDVEANINKRLRRLEGGALNNAIAAGEAAVHAFEIVNGAIENATRLAAYMAARDVGMTKADAGMLAVNLTVNFTKKGELGSAINALYMFANASIQGTVRVGTAMTNKRVRRATYLLAVVGALGALFNILGGGDDDDGDPLYSKIKPYIRDKNLIVMWPKGWGHDGMYLKIPLPYGFSPFHVLGDRLAGVTLGKDKPGAAMWAVLTSIADAFNPLGEESASMLSLIPSVFRPAAHIQTNKNWTGNPLYPDRDYEKNKPDSEKSFRSNSAFSKEAARDINKATGGSPYKSGWADWHPGSIDHVLESLTGGLGKFVKDVIATGTGIYHGDPFDATKAPIIRRFVGTVKSPETDAAAYYEKRDEARKNGGDAIKNAQKDRARGINKDDAESFLRENTNSARGEQIFKNADEAMKPLRDRQSRIEANKDMSHEDRRKALDEVTERMRAIQNRARKQYKEATKPDGSGITIRPGAAR